MSKERSSPTVLAHETTQSANDEGNPHPSLEIRRRSFLKGLGVTGAAVTLGTGIMAKGIPLFAEERSGSLTKGDAAILRFLAAAEIIESYPRLQSQQLGGTHADQRSKLPRTLI